MAAALVPAIPVAAKPVAPSVVGANSAYTAVVPNRLMDTRNAGGALGSGGTRDLVVAGGTSGVPAGATGVVLNVTVTNTTAASFLTVYPAGTARPLASNLNWVAGNTIPNLVEVPVGTGGAVTFYNSAGSTDVVADLEGYFTAPSGTAGGHVALTPARITDTRVGSGQANAGSRLTQGGTLNVQATGAGGVPTSGVSGVILNVTVVNTSQASFLTVYPTGASRPLASNVNWMPTQVIPNRVFVPVGTGGQVTVYNQWGTTDVVIDVSGYFTDATATGKSFTPQNPVRLLDTRLTGGRLGAGGTGTLQITGTQGVPSGATAVILNVTVTATTAPSFLTVYPSTASRPTASDLNWVGGVTIPNLTVATLGSTGAITYYNSAGSTDVVIDLFGFFGGSANSVTVGAAPSSIQANGTSTSTVTATVTSGGSPVVGNTVAFSVGSGSPAAACGTLVAPSSLVTDVNGKATTTYKSSTTAGTCVVTATESGGASGNTTITQTTPSNQTYTVTPAGSTTVPISTNASPDAGNVTYNVTGLTANTTVCISEFPKDGPNGPTNSAGVWTFNPSGATPNTALGEGGTDAAPNPPGTAAGGFIRSVNGAPTAGGNSSANLTRHVCGIGTGAGAALTFILNSFTPDLSDVVVYTDTNGDGKLGVASSGSPTEAFGASDPTWQSPGAGIGGYNNEIVQSIDTSAKTFQACITPGNGSTCNTFSYANAGNAYNYPSPNGVGTIPLTQAQFQSYLSAQSPPFCATPCAGTGGFTPTGSQVPGDALNLISYNPTGPSTFTFSSDVPSAPTGVTATYTSGTGVVLNWTAPANPDVAQDTTNTATYCVLRATVTSGTVGAFGGFINGSSTGNTSCGGGTNNAVQAKLGAPPATTLTDDSVVASTTYVYEVFAQANVAGGGQTGPASASSNQVPVPATAAKAPTSKQSVLTQGSGISQNAKILDPGDTLQFVFNNVTVSNPLTVAGTWSVNLIDWYGAEVQLSNTNSTATISGSGTTLTIAVTAAPTLIGSATPGSFSPTPTAYNSDSRGAVKSATGIGTAAPFSWNLPGSGCDPGSDFCPGGTTFTRQIPDTCCNTPLNTNSTTDNNGSTTCCPPDYLPFQIDDNGCCFSVDTTANKITLDPGMEGFWELRNNDPVAFFNGKGELIASGTYDNTLGNSFTPSPALIAGQIVYGVYNLQFSDSAGTMTFTNATMWPSRTAQRTAPTTIPQVDFVDATGGSNTIAVHWDNKVNQIGGPGDYTVWNATDTAQVFTGTATSGSGTSTITVTLNGTLAAGTDYFLHVASGSVQNSSTLQPNPAQDVFFHVSTSTPTITGVTGPCFGGASCTTSQTQPTWTGTASTNAGATFGGTGSNAIRVSKDFASYSTAGVTVLSGSGTNNISWSYTPTSPLGNGTHYFTFRATDSLGNSAFSSITITENGNSVSIANSSVVASPSTNVPDNNNTGPLPSHSNVTVTLRDTNNNPVPGKSVTLAATTNGAGGTITGSPGTTNSLGQVTFVVADNTAETVTYTATDTTDANLVVGTTTVTYIDPAYTQASGSGGALQITATFNDAVCRSAVFAATDWVVTGSVQGVIAVSSDNGVACNGGNSNGTSTITLTLGSIMATGQSVTVQLTAGGAAKLRNITAHSPATASHAFST